MGNLKQYDHGVEVGAMEEIDREIDASSNNEFVGKIPEGESEYRILPPLERGGDVFKLIHEHYIEVVVDGQKRKRRFVCARSMTKGKQRCPACEENSRLMKGNAVDRNNAKEFQPKPRVYLNVINRDRPEDGPKILTIPKSVWSDIKKLRTSRRGGDFARPTKEGFDIIIDREGTGFETKYKVYPSDHCALSEDEDEAVEWIENQHNLEDYAVLNEYKHNLALMSGIDPATAERASSRLERAERRTRRLSSGEVDEEDGQTYDTEASERPRRRRRKDEDEEETPRRRKRRPRRTAAEQLDEDDIPY